jgi:hypothetical protein
MVKEENKMTVSKQTLSGDELFTFEGLEEDEEFQKTLGPAVQRAIERAGSDRLKEEIAIEVRAEMQKFTGARVENIIDQSVNRQLEEVIGKAITDEIEKRRDQFRPEIDRVVKKALDAKLNDLKEKSLAPLKKKGRK